jgi:hypothetical protein
MSAAQINEELSTYLPLLSNSQKKLLLDVVKNILNVEPTSKNICVDTYNSELEHSSKQIEEGKFISHKDFLSKHK